MWGRSSKSLDIARSRSLEIARAACNVGDVVTVLGAQVGRDDECRSSCVRGAGGIRGTGRFGGIRTYRRSSRMALARRCTTTCPKTPEQPEPISGSAGRRVGRSASRRKSQSPDQPHRVRSESAYDSHPLGECMTWISARKVHMTPSRSESGHDESPRSPGAHTSPAGRGKRPPSPRALDAWPLVLP
jgi:hypothetical protein